MLSPFGKEIRKYRIDKNIRLIDMANALEVSSAYISAVELGKKNLSKELCTKIFSFLQLTVSEANRLYELALQTNRTVRFNMDALDGNTKEMVAVFARNLNKLSNEEMEKIKRILASHDQK